MGPVLALPLLCPSLPPFLPPLLACLSASLRLSLALSLALSLSLSLCGPHHASPLISSLRQAGSDSDDVSQPLRFGVSGIQQQLLRSRREAHVATKGNEEASDNDDWDHIDTELLESVEYAVDADSNEVERTSSDSFPTGVDCCAAGVASGQRGALVL